MAMPSGARSCIARRRLCAPCAIHVAQASPARTQTGRARIRSNGQHTNTFASSGTPRSRQARPGKHGAPGARVASGRCRRCGLRARSNEAGTRSNLWLPRPCASAPPMPRSHAGAGTSLRHVPARASVAADSHGRLWSHSTMPSMASAAKSRRSRVCVRAIGLRSAVPRGYAAMNSSLVNQGHNPSIERTNRGKPRFAAHVER